MVKPEGEEDNEGQDSSTKKGAGNPVYPNLCAGWTGTCGGQAADPGWQWPQHHHSPSVPVPPAVPTEGNSAGDDAAAAAAAAATATAEAAAATEATAAAAAAAAVAASAAAAVAAATVPAADAAQTAAPDAAAATAAAAAAAATEAAAAAATAAVATSAAAAAAAATMPVAEAAQTAAPDCGPWYIQKALLFRWVPVPGCAVDERNSAALYFRRWEVGLTAVRIVTRLWKERRRVRDKEMKLRVQICYLLRSHRWGDSQGWIEEVSDLAGDWLSQLTAVATLLGEGEPATGAPIGLIRFLDTGHGGQKEGWNLWKTRMFREVPPEFRKS
ncbi:unnamed protein product [Polarella glacialis]|uniref:Uncharacterized protein n=1 Tax=Polarella glacialis TaxID=89957 RepID=A0A813GV21_POLGL|nr:unnamed protein product [Polarella glacialis]